MKKILKAAMIILAMAVSGTGVWASNDHPRYTQAQIAQLRAEHKAHHQKQTKPSRTVAGKAVRGANQVSPKPMKRDH
jgi:hypothetical protein